jgi:DNA-binding CsgD family transcriptional regulator
MQNRLLAQFLDKSIHPPVRVSTDTESAHDEGSIVLRDCLGFDGRQLESYVERMAVGSGIRGKQVLFNVAPGSGIETIAIQAGFAGVFYTSDSLELMARGLRAILEGDLWFSRQAFSRCIAERHSTQTLVRRKGTGHLTSRELEVLGLLAMGATNENIAEKFCISPATVKTHLYHIYKKIEARNRLQAVLWAAQNL